MRVRRLWVLGSLLLLTSSLEASDHVFDLFMAPSYVRAKGSTIDLGGWHVSGAATLKKEQRLSFIADISTHFFGSHDEEDVTQVTFMAGPRWTFLRKTKHMPYVHVMVLGAVYRSEKIEGLDVGSAAGALAFGAGYDFVFRKEGPMGVRAQVDYIVPLGTDQESSVRISLGFVYRFHNH
jgi:hypothetical protein